MDIITMIKYEWKKNWKLLIGSVFLIYCLKFVFSYINDWNPGEAGAFGLLISVTGVLVLTVYLFSTAVSSERENNTMSLLFAGRTPRTKVLTGKFLGITTMIFSFITLLIPTMTPGYLFDLSWIWLCLLWLNEFNYMLVIFLFLISSFSIMISNFGFSSVKSVIFTSIILCCLLVLQISTYGEEAYFLVHLIFIMIFLTASLKMIARGDLYTKKLIFMRMVPVVITGFLISMIIIYGVATYIFDNDSVGEDDFIYNVTKSYFQGKLWVNRSRVTGNLSLPSLHETGITTIDKNGKWEKYGKRHMFFKSQSPDASALLIEEHRNFMNLFSRSKSKFSVIDKDGRKTEIIRDFSSNLDNDRMAWGKNGDLFIIDTYITRKKYYEKKKFYLISCIDGKVHDSGYINAYKIENIFVLKNGNILVSGSFSKTDTSNEWMILKISDNYEKIEKKSVQQLANCRFKKMGGNNQNMVIYKEDRNYYMCDLNGINFDSMEDLSTEINFRILEDYIKDSVIIRDGNWSAATIRKQSDENVKKYKIQWVREKNGEISKGETDIENTPSLYIWSESGNKLCFVSRDANMEFNNVYYSEYVNCNFLGNSSKKIRTKDIPEYMRRWVNNKNMEELQWKSGIYVLDIDKGGEPELIREYSETIKSRIAFTWIDENKIAVTKGNKLEFIDLK